MPSQDIFNTQIFNLFGAPFMLERRDAPDVDRKLANGEPAVPPAADDDEQEAACIAKAA